MKILFICYANVCRSFMAQELLKKLAPSLDVFSRGLYADPSFKIPSKVTDFLVANGITNVNHTPTPLTASDLEQADYIFLMEQAHLDKLTDKFAQYSDKMWLLSDFATNQDYDVLDPITLSGKSFTKSAQKLSDLVTLCSKRILSTK